MPAFTLLFGGGGGADGGAAGEGEGTDNWLDEEEEVEEKAREKEVKGVEKVVEVGASERLVGERVKREVLKVQRAEERDGAGASRLTQR